ncbi:MAG: hypothetical protein ABFS45_15015 [Pseudomonadota bacterium]
MKTVFGYIISIVGFVLAIFGGLIIWTATRPDLQILGDGSDAILPFAVVTAIGIAIMWGGIRLIRSTRTNVDKAS